MKLPLNFGVTSRAPYLYVESNGQLSGILKPYLFTQFYFLFRKFNVTFISLGRSRSSSCNDDGLCTGSLANLQTGTVDFVDQISKGQFATLPVNITLGPVIMEDKCHLINTPDIKVAIRSEHFLDPDERIDYPVATTTVLFCLGLILILISANRYLIDTPNRLTVWNLFGIAFNSDFIPLINSTSLYGLNFSLFWFIISTLFITSLQTGLIRSSDFEPIETLQEILIHKYIPTTFGTLHCRYSIEQSNATFLKKIRAKLDVIERLSPGSIIKALSDNHRVIIASKHTGLLLKGLLCTVSDSEVIYISQASMFHLLFLFATGSSTKLEISETAAKLAYRAFESSNYDNHVTRRIDFECLGFTSYYSQCIQSEINVENIIITPLTFEYFDELLIVVFLFAILASIVFLLEAIFPPKYIEY